MSIRSSIMAALFGLVVATSGTAAQNLSAMSRDDIVALQRRLVDGGCYTGALDGNAGPALEAAVKTCPGLQPLLRIETGMHTALIYRIGVDNACRLAATGSDDKTVRLWSLPEGRLLRTQRLPIGEGNLGKIFSVAVSPDGSRIAAGGWDTKINVAKAYGVYVFDSATGTTVRHVGAFGNIVLNLAFSPDGKRLAVALGGAQGVRVLDVETGNELMADRDYQGVSYGIAFGPDGTLYAIAYDGFVRRYGSDLKRKAKVATVGGKQPFSISVHPKGQQVAVGYSDSAAVEILDAGSLRLITAADTKGVQLGHLGTVTWSADGRHLVAGGNFSKLFGQQWRFPARIWDNDGQQLGEDVPVGENTIQSLASCGDVIAYSAGGPAFGLFRANGKIDVLGKSHIPDMHSKRGDAFTVSDDGLRVRFGLEHAAARPVLFDIATGTLNEAPELAPDLRVSDLTSLKVTDWLDKLNPTIDGKTISLIDTEKSQSLAVRSDRSGFVLGAYYSLRSFTGDGSQRWLSEVPGVAWGVNLARNGELVVAAHGDGTIRWYRWSDGKELLALFVHRDDQRWVAWTPTGYYMASAGAEDLIGWHVNRGWEQPADFFPVVRFRNQFYRPDIVKLVLETLDEPAAVKRANDAAKRPEQLKSIYALQPPVIRVTNFDEGGRSTFSSETREIAYELRSPSGRAVERVDVLIDGRPHKIIALAQQSANAASVRTGKFIAEELPKRDIEMALIAWSGDQASEPARIKLSWAGARAEDLLKPKLYALVIGVSNYVADELKLNYAAKDAVDFADALKAQEGGMYSKVEVKRLVDREVTRDSINEGMEWLEEQVTARDVGIVFLAGHGVTDEKQTYWFLPADATRERLRTKGVVQDDIRRTLRNLAGKAILFLDTCHSGQLMKVATRGGPVDMDAVINDFKSAENGVIVFASSKGSEVSVELHDLKNGAFTKALVTGIKDGRANLLGTGRITPSQLDAYVTEEVKKLTGGKQHPVMSKPDTIPDFPFAIVR